MPVNMKKEPGGGSLRSQFGAQPLTRASFGGTGNIGKLAGIGPQTYNGTMQPTTAFGPELSRPQTPLLGGNRQFDPTFGGGTSNQYTRMPGGTITSGGNMQIDPNFGVMPGGSPYRTMQPVLGGRMQLAPESPWLTAFKRLMARHRGGF